MDRCDAFGVEPEHVGWLYDSSLFCESGSAYTAVDLHFRRFSKRAEDLGTILVPGSAGSYES